ncbi:MAG: 2-hydroxyacyl-CoA dehydratase [Dehalococcoidia bacterium]|nr:2-hydroxyacyl-CoA dehydratase [Dehalococcoidia bacterium]
MTEAVCGGVVQARELYEHRSQRARELSRQGRRIIGYFCCYTPVEVITALNLMPYRIQGGAGKSIKHADQYLETIMCPYVRSCFDLAMNGDYDFLSGAVIPHSCDAMHRVYDIWKYYLKPPYSRCITVPHMTHEASFEYFRKEIEDFQASLEKFAGRRAGHEDLAGAISLHNRNRALLRELYELRKADPPPVSGTEIVQLLVAGMTVPVEEYNRLVEDVIFEVRGRKPPSEPKPRIMIVGNEIDDVALVRLAEDSGASVVMDDTCTGTRAFWKDVDTSKPSLAALADRYLGGITCPCTYRPGTASQRFEYLVDYARGWDVRGVLVYSIRYCDTYQLDAPEIKEFLESEGIRVLYLEDDYVVPPVGQWKTRIEAFLETLEP